MWRSLTAQTRHSDSLKIRFIRLIREAISTPEDAFSGASQDSFQPGKFLSFQPLPAITKTSPKAHQSLMKQNSLLRRIGLVDGQGQPGQVAKPNNNESVRETGAF